MELLFHLQSFFMRWCLIGELSSILHCALWEKCILKWLIMISPNSILHGHKRH